jgi:hypothetical protein
VRRQPTNHDLGDVEWLLEGDPRDVSELCSESVACRPSVDETEEGSFFYILELYRNDRPDEAAADAW